MFSCMPNSNNNILTSFVQYRTKYAICRTHFICQYYHKFVGRMESKDKQPGSLTEESIKRKEKLKRLRDLAAKSDKTQSSNGQALPRPFFRSYKPHDENINGEVLEQVPTGDIEKQIESQLELLKTPIIIDEIDIANLAPRRPDWDLKRDVAKKLEKLDRQTQKAIAELIRERLKNNQDEIFDVVAQL